MKDKFKKIEKVLPNRLRNDKFEPSKSEQYISLKDYGYFEKNIIWVDETNLNICLKEVSSSKIIGIDT